MEHWIKLAEEAAVAHKVKCKAVRKMRDEISKQKRVLGTLVQHQAELRLKKLAYESIVRHSVNRALYDKLPTTIVDICKDYTGYDVCEVCHTYKPINVRCSHKFWDFETIGICNISNHPNAVQGFQVKADTEVFDFMMHHTLKRFKRIAALTGNIFVRANATIRFCASRVTFSSTCNQIELRKIRNKRKLAR